MRYIRKSLDSFRREFRGSYLKKCLEPRFHPQLLRVCAQAIRSKSPDLPEIKKMYREFCDMLIKDGSFSKGYLIKIRLVRFLLTRMGGRLYIFLSGNRYVDILKRLTGCHKSR